MLLDVPCMPVRIGACSLNYRDLLTVEGGYGSKQRMAELIALHSGQTLEQIQEDSERDRWFTAEAAQEYGLVDKVLENKKELLGEAGEKKDES